MSLSTTDNERQRKTGEVLALRSTLKTVASVLRRVAACKEQTIESISTTIDALATDLDSILEEKFDSLVP